MAKKFDIFISYRRKGGFDTAKHLYDRLTLEGYSVSFDIDTLRSGDFDEALIQRIDECSDFILILNKEIFDRFSAPDYDPKEDWVRIEIAYALEKKKNIIPFILDGFAFPPNLPPDIAGIARKNALEHSQKNFEGIYSKLQNAFLHSKPRVSVRYRKPILAVLILFVIVIIGYLVSEIVQSKNDADDMVSAERAKAAASADSLKRVSDSINVSMAQFAAVLADSLKKKTVPSASQGEKIAGSKTNSKPAVKSKVKNLYWVGNGDESGSIIFGKLSAVGFKNGKCAGDGLSVSLNKPSCKISSVGMVKCNFQPTLTVSDCGGSSVGKVIHFQTFSGSSKDELTSKQKIIDELQNANFTEWVSELKKEW